VYLNTIENDFIEYLKYPPQKPARGISLRTQSESSVYSQADDETTFFSDDEEALKKIKMKTVNIGKIGGVKDLKSGKFYKPADAENMKLINIAEGWYRNSITMEYLQLSDAIDQKLIVLEKVKDKEESKTNDDKKKQSSMSRSTSKSSIKSFNETFENDENKFVITSVIDPLRKTELNIDQAVTRGLFDINSGMYVHPSTKEKLTMVDAIDQGLIKITHNIQTSYNVNIDHENSNKTQTSKKTLSIRFVINTDKQLIIPINEAIDEGIVDMDKGIFIDAQKRQKISLEKAYDEGLALTIDDINNSSSNRCNFKIDTVRNIKTGKEMTMKRAITKGWLDLERRIYYNKYLKQEIPISQALDMNLIVLKALKPQ
jgi:hypothetical protein